MKIGLFSDVHANFEAMRAVLDFLRGKGVERYVFLGDIVGYGADPGACLRELRALVEREGCVCIAGNHDRAVAGTTPVATFSPAARTAVEWTRSRLGHDDMEFLTGLPLEARGDGYTCVHANLDDPAAWGYLLDIDDAALTFQNLQDPVCFVGHTHRPVVFTAAGMMDWAIEAKTVLRPGTRYIINVGSVGQPRDGNPLACCAIFDTAEPAVRIHRVPYDIAAAQRKILDAGLPEILAERLARGK